MATTFKGHKTAFNKTGSNTATPNYLGAPSTDFKGRGGVPEGKLKHYPGQVANIEGGNRRLGKATHGAGEQMDTYFCGTSAFNSEARDPKTKARNYNTKGGVGSGFRKSSKQP